MLRAVLFDAAGTLIRLRRPVGETYAAAAREQGVSLPAAHVEDAFRRVLAGMPTMVFPGLEGEALRDAERGWWRELVRRTFRAADGSARFRDLEGLFAALFAHYGTAAAWTPAPGAREALRGLAARGLRLGVASNFDHRLPGLLAELGLLPPLERVVLPGEVGAAKPDRRLFEAAVSALGVSAHETVYVGDDPERDVAGARAAGLRAVAVTELATLASLPAHLSAMEDDPRS